MQRPRLKTLFVHKLYLRVAEAQLPPPVDVRKCLLTCRMDCFGGRQCAANIVIVNNADYVKHLN